MKNRNKPCKFEESILAQIGWSEEDYKEQQLNICNLKMANNIRLTPQETKEYIQFSGEKRMTINNDLTEQWKRGELKSGLYYVGNDKITDIAFVKNNLVEVYTLDSNIPKLLKKDVKILAKVPSYGEWNAEQ